MGDSKQLGVFNARAIDGDWALSTGKSTGGTPSKQAVVRFTIAEGQYQGTYRWYGSTNTPENAKRTLASLEACGVDIRTQEGLASFKGLDANDVEVTLEESTYEGKTTKRLAWVNPVGGGIALKPIEPAQKAGFLAGMLALSSTMPKPPPAPAKTAPKPDADAPF